MQNMDLRIKNYKQFVVEIESGATKKIFIFEFSFQLNFVFCLLLQVLNIVCHAKDSKVTHILQEKIVQFQLAHQIFF